MQSHPLAKFFGQNVRFGKFGQNKGEIWAKVISRVSTRTILPILHRATPQYLGPGSAPRTFALRTGIAIPHHKCRTSALHRIKIFNDKLQENFAGFLCTIPFKATC